MCNFRLIRLVLIGLALLCASLSPPSALAWEFTEPGGGGTIDQATAVAIRGHVVAVDPVGNVALAGETGADFTVLKLRGVDGADF